MGLAALLSNARHLGVGVAAFNVILLEHAEAIVDAAESERLPVVLQVSENAVRYHEGRLAPIAAGCRAIASSASVSVALHLDHVTSVDLCHQAEAIGFGSLMFDASALPYEAIVAATTDVGRWAHARGLLIEAELGAIGGKDGVHAPGARTDPAEALDFVARTQVDALAVAVGTSHAMLERTATIDLELVERLHQALSVPLVLHGSSGASDAMLQASIAKGMTKINVATQLNEAWTTKVREGLSQDDRIVDPRRYLAPARSEIAKVVARLLRLIAAAPQTDPAARPGQLTRPR